MQKFTLDFDAFYLVLFDISSPPRDLLFFFPLPSSPGCVVEDVLTKSNTPTSQIYRLRHNKDDLRRYSWCLLRGSTNCQQILH